MNIRQNVLNLILATKACYFNNRISLTAGYIIFQWNTSYLTRLTFQSQLYNIITKTLQMLISETDTIIILNKTTQTFWGNSYSLTKLSKRSTLAVYYRVNKREFSPPLRVKGVLETRVPRWAPFAILAPNVGLLCFQDIRGVQNSWLKISKSSAVRGYKQNSTTASRQM